MEVVVAKHSRENRLAFLHANANAIERAIVYSDVTVEQLVKDYEVSRSTFLTWFRNRYGCEIRDLRSSSVVKVDTHTVELRVAVMLYRDKLGANHADTYHAILSRLLDGTPMPTAERARLLGVVEGALLHAGVLSVSQVIDRRSPPTKIMFKD
jgi:methylphosphotriester-DNA--protein-cysteine methyltransferase